MKRLQRDSDLVEHEGKRQKTEDKGAAVAAAVAQLTVEERIKIGKQKEDEERNKLLAGNTSLMAALKSRVVKNP